MRVRAASRRPKWRYAAARRVPAAVSVPSGSETRSSSYYGVCPMAPRAYWKGYLKLSLVSCPIALNPATSSSERISFRQINKKTGNRLRQQLVDDVTREPVDAADKGKGYEIDKGIYIDVDDDEIEALQI